MKKFENKGFLIFWFSVRSYFLFHFFGILWFPLISFGFLWFCCFRPPCPWPKSSNPRPQPKCWCVNFLIQKCELHMYICLYIHMYVYICTHICIHTRIYMCACVHTQMHNHTNRRCTRIYIQGVIAPVIPHMYMHISIHSDVCENTTVDHSI